jgi:pro-kumamolisin-like protein/PKD domain-containing protein
MSTLVPRRQKMTICPFRMFVLGVILAMLLPVGVSGALPGALPSGPPSQSGFTSQAAPLGPVTVAPGFATPPGAEPLGPLSSETPLTVFVGLSSPALQDLPARIALEYTPGSELYGRYLSASDFATEFGASPAAYARAVQYFELAGLEVTPSPDRLFLTVSGSSAEVGHAFGTSFETFRIGNRVVFSHNSPATLPAGIPWSGALGLGNLTPFQPLETPVPATVNPGTVACGSGTCLSPSDVETAYNESGLLGHGVNGSGVTVAIVDAYDSDEPQSALASDLADFGGTFGLPVGQVDYLYPVPTSIPLNSSSPSGWGGEESLDMQWTRAMAPGATVDMTFSPDPDAGLYVAVDWLVAHHAADVITMSWGEPDVGMFNPFDSACASGCNATADGSYTLLGPVLAEAAAEGITAFAASGDCGAADGTSGVSTNFPASDPYITGVGATALTVNSSGGYVSESGWSGNSSGASFPGCENQGGSGGGWAPTPRPPWQDGSGLAGSPLFRGVPDVSAVGAGATPVATFYHGTLRGVAGTSVASPVWAGMTSVGDQRAGRALGFLDPALYAVLRGPDYSAAVHDVTIGNNGYSAGVGWDPVTGIGTPNDAVLFPLLANETGVTGASGLSVELHATGRYGSAPLMVTFSTNVTVNGSAVAPAFTDIYFGDGNAMLAPEGTASHVYTAEGAYFAQAIAETSAGGTAVSPPVVIDVGGEPLDVNLTANATSVPVGGSIAFTSLASGGSVPYTFTFEFGDGTFVNATPSALVDHTFWSAGGYCVSVAVRDSASPTNAGTSNELAVAVGGAAPPGCAHPAPLTLQLNAGPSAAADLPGDFSFNPIIQGGTPPYSVAYRVNDGYAETCQCGIFRTVGTHEVTYYVNDSLNEEATATLPVALYPELTASYTSSSLSGPAPLTGEFGATVDGGHGANTTHWSFGDGTSAVGVNVSHAWTSPGFYLVLADSSDQGRGNASEAFLVDVTNASAPSPFQLSATVAPSTNAGAGPPFLFRAEVNGGVGPFLFHWQLGANDSAYGPSVNESFSQVDCLGTGGCPLDVGLSVWDADGAEISTGFNLTSYLALRSEALNLTDTFGASQVTAPYLLEVSANAFGLPSPKITWTVDGLAEGSGDSFEYTFGTVGHYTISVRATDGLGDLVVRNLALQVGPSGSNVLVGAAGAAPDHGLAPLEVNFSAAATDGLTDPIGYSWNFGDGGTAMGASVSHLFPNAGNYTASVTATNTFGDLRTFETPVIVSSVAPVNITGTLSPSPAAPSAEVRVTLAVAVTCSRYSLPSCGPAAPALSFAWLADGASPSSAVSFGQYAASPNGSIAVTALAPAVVGDYRLEVTSVTVGYAGNGSVALTVATPTSSPPSTSSSGGFSLEDAVLAGGAIAVAAMALVTFVVLRKARARRPAGPRRGIK